MDGIRWHHIPRPPQYDVSPSPPARSPPAGWVVWSLAPTLQVIGRSEVHTQSLRLQNVKRPWRRSAAEVLNSIATPETPAPNKLFRAKPAPYSIPSPPSPVLRPRTQEETELHSNRSKRSSSAIRSNMGMFRPVERHGARGRSG
ncbi:uncharacterized protein BO80DRAFT_247791 [Aspergillus ibericus CBS 121593]|uniref:Uncharacterized protein n=1 Tax=Aspergillus ibericus CBS 121593 TaxID=1448316 RepID=A0A395GK49_9EURO|nr:hypothetical protein BO80DRAFT_247791 [Aspergillus ibericus CBS 121593]RAK95861.1 hypothetical protein BO80DRAFT_247791 [Aspergillus ibericus CBS 121593]